MRDPRGVGDRCEPGSPRRGVRRASSRARRSCRRRRFRRRDQPLGVEQSPVAASSGPGRAGPRASGQLRRPGSVDLRRRAGTDRAAASRSRARRARRRIQAGLLGQPRRYSRAVSSARGACPVAASARISSSTAGSRSGSSATRLSGRTRPRRRRLAAISAISRSVGPGAARLRPSATVAAAVAPRRGRRAPDRARAPAPRGAVAAAAVAGRWWRPRGHGRASARAASSPSGVEREAVPAVDGEATRGRPEVPRSRDTWLCRAARPDSGGASGHSASTSWSAVTARPSAMASSASTARRFGPRTSTGAPSTTSRSGPSTSTRTRRPDGASPTHHPRAIMPARQRVQGACQPMRRSRCSTEASRPPGAGPRGGGQTR